MLKIQLLYMYCFINFLHPNMQMASSFFYLARIFYINVTLTLNKDWREAISKLYIWLWVMM